MALHEPWDRHLVTDGGSVMTAGGSLDIAKGQLGIFDMTTANQTATGNPAMADFAAATTDQKFEIKLGTGSALTRSGTNKAMASFPFTVNDVVALEVSAPEDNATVDEMIVGYDGTAGTGFVFQAGETTELSLKLSGEAMGYLGYVDTSVIIKAYFEAPADAADIDNEAITQEVIDQLTAKTLLGDTPITDFLEFTLESSVPGDPTSETGIRIKALPVTLGSDDESYRFEIPFLNTSTRIEVAGGYPINVNENFAGYEDGRFNVTVISRASEQTNLGGDLRDWELRGDYYFTRQSINRDSQFSREVYGQESRLDQFTQYVDYALTVNRVKFSQAFNRKQSETIVYHIIAPRDSHADVEALLNSLATAAGIPTVEAYPVVAP